MPPVHLAPLTFLALVLALPHYSSAQTLLYKINCGGPAISSKGWSSDDGSFRSGATAGVVSEEVKTANSNAIFHTFVASSSAKAGSTFTYNLPVGASGNFRVNLTFMESSVRSTPRTFSVKAEGSAESSITLQTYKVKVTKKMVTTVTDGTLTLVLTNGNARAILSAFSVERMTSPSPSTTTVAPSSSSPSSPPLAERWVRRESLPLDIDEVCTQLVGNNVYLLGGGADELFVYNLATGTWSERAKRLYSGNHHAMHVYKNRLFVIGGIYIGNSKVQIYDIATDRWTPGPNIPWNVEGAVASATIGQRVYVCGGILGEGTVGKCGYLDMQTLQWTRTSSMPLARNHASSGTDGSRLFIFGGRQGGNYVSNGYDEIQVYDPATDTWETSAQAGSGLQKLPVNRGGMGRAVFVPQTSEFYIMGGETESGKGANEYNVYNRVDVYNINTNTWRKGVPMPTARHGIDPIGIPTGDGHIGSIFVAGGGEEASMSFSHAVEELLLE